MNGWISIASASEVMKSEMKEEWKWLRVKQHVQHTAQMQSPTAAGRLVVRQKTDSRKRRERNSMNPAAWSKLVVYSAMCCFLNISLFCPKILAKPEEPAPGARPGSSMKKRSRSAPRKESGLFWLFFSKRKGAAAPVALLQKYNTRIVWLTFHVFSSVFLHSNERTRSDSLGILEKKKKKKRAGSQNQSAGAGSRFPALFCRKLRAEPQYTATLLALLGAGFPGLLWC